ncbi:MAG TPA: peptide chain release factor 2 [Kiritimatiellia bacterium]|nr:peptide chain release factor 2 [Kiritimatiellia bacterium]
MELQDIERRISKLQDGILELRGYLDVEAKTRRIEELDALATTPGFWDDNHAARKVIGQTNALKAVVEPFSKLESDIGDIRMLFDFALEESGDAKEQGVADVEKALTQIEAEYRKFEIQSLLSDRLDANNAYISLNAGAGGTESCDWASMLFRMYTRYCEDHGFELSVMDLQKGDEAGIKSVTFMVSGPYAYGYLKGERGVHRLVRISPFDSNKRRHTSFVALDTVAEIDDDIEVEINEKDLRVDTYRSSGAGGQHVNKTDSAIRIVHIPTGVVVQCQAERSQHSNRDKAMKMLSAKLYELERDKQRREMEQFYGDKGEIAWGRQIRSYVMQPYTMVKDHRTGAETSNVEAVMDGELDVFIEAYLKQRKG